MNTQGDVKDIIKRYKLERNSIFKRIKSTSVHPYKLENIIKSFETLPNPSPIFKNSESNTNTEIVNVSQ